MNTGGHEARSSNLSFLCLAALFANSLACVPSVRGASQIVKPPCQTQKILRYWYSGWLRGGVILDNHEDLLALTEKELLAGILQELRKNTGAVEHLQDITAEIYSLQKEAAWDR